MFVRPAVRGDLAAMIRIHAQAFEGFFLTDLGPAFLREYYRTVCEYAAGITLVASSSSTPAIQGFVAGFVDPGAFYRRLRSRRWRLAVAALPALLRSPALLPRLISNSRRVKQSGHAASTPGEAELASIAVAPSAQGTGLGTQLTQAFISDSRTRGAERISLTTDADGNDLVNRFYLALGFRVRETFAYPPNRRMHRYEFTFQDQDRSVAHRAAA